MKKIAFVRIRKERNNRNRRNVSLRQISNAVCLCFSDFLRNYADRIEEELALDENGDELVISPLETKLSWSRLKKRIKKEYGVEL